MLLPNYKTGITDSTFDIVDEAFLPGRKLLLLSIGASFAYSTGADFVSIGLMNEENALFPDHGLIYEGVFTATPLKGQNISCLIGRDVLSNAVLIYLGNDNSFTLSLA